MVKKWLPLESNPDVLNDFSKKLGLDTSQYSFHDVYGMDPVSPVLCDLSRFLPLYWTGGVLVASSYMTVGSPALRLRISYLLQELLAMVPQPVIALLLLFPITDQSEAASKTGKYVQ